MRDATRAAEFYGRVFGFEIVESAFGGRAVFLRAAAGDNHHDLGLFSVGRMRRGRRAARSGSTTSRGRSRRSRTSRGRPDLSDGGCPGGASDHGVSKSLYGADPDGNEFEIMWRVPRDAWGEYAEKGAVMPLDIDAEVARWGAGGGRSRPDLHRTRSCKLAPVGVDPSGFDDPWATMSRPKEALHGPARHRQAAIDSTTRRFA